MVTNDNKHLSYLLGLALDRFQIEIALCGSSVLDAVSRPESGKVDIWLARLTERTPEVWRTLAPGRDDPSQPSRPVPLAVVCDGGETQVADALSHGVSAVILPDDSAFDTAAGVHAAASRELFISPRLLRRLDDRLTDALASRMPRTDTLTDREERVLALMADGMSNADIGRSLHISPATVSTHVGNILRKLEARNRTEAVTTGLEWSLIARPARRPVP
ncbi:response regulator transcription factor [Streptomyces albiaxialis]|uniref:helix-turn-helix transcriptional regulator n=1 Tax=Streptomyces albiaxialis TaxID=329523 RepID=UPI0031E38290